MSIVISFFGLLLAWAHYVRKEQWPAKLAKPFTSWSQLFDTSGTWMSIYDRLIVSPLKAVSGWFARSSTRRSIDGAVNGVGAVCMDAGEAVRKLQNGAVPTYAFSIFAGRGRSALLLVYWVTCSWRPIQDVRQ